MGVVVSIALIATASLLTGLAMPLTIATLGFGPAGVAAGSAAAGIQAGIGNVAAGSLFAFMQSIGTAPLLSAAIGAITGATGSIVVLIGTLIGFT